MSKSNNKSFTILEVIMAIFILSVGVFGSYSLIQQSLIAVSLNQSKLVAYYLNQEGLEIIRNIRDGNWLEKRTNPGLSWSDGLLSACLTPRISPCDFYGDVNFDGVVTQEDVTSDVWMSCFNKAAENFCVRGDLDGSGRIDITDFGIIADYLANCSIVSFPVCDTKARFKREITITPETPDRLKVSAKVSWKERERNYNVEVLDYLYNWR